MFSRESCNRGIRIASTVVCFGSALVLARFRRAATAGYLTDLDEGAWKGLSHSARRNAAAFIHLPAILRTMGFARLKASINRPLSRRRSSRPETIMTSLMQRNTRPIRHGAPPRLFDIGQAVRLKGDFRTSTAEVYHVTGTLPPKENSPQYRIRSDTEPHERVVTEDRLESAGTPASDPGLMLIERTFGHGQGTAALQSRDEEAKAGKTSDQA